MVSNERITTPGMTVLPLFLSWLKLLISSLSAALGDTANPSSLQTEVRIPSAATRAECQPALAFSPSKNSLASA